MNKDSQESSDGDEGFEAQQISIQKRVQPVTILRLNTDEQANDLINDLRPKDFLPRIVYKQMAFGYVLVLQRTLSNKLLNTCTFQQSKKLVPIIQQNSIKCKKYHSLQQKYNDNNFSIVYNKFKTTNSQDYLHSYINLQKIVDFSVLNFATFNNQQIQQSLFDSNFQSGNLLYAYKVLNNQYDLILQNDTNTKGYTQWFYFSYEYKQKAEVTFNIVSMIKKKTLFQKGVKPSFFVSNGQNKWKQITSQVKYYKNGVIRQNGQPYYTLSFKYFSIGNQKVYFSLNLPYTYTKMINLVKQIEQISLQQIQIQRKTLCYSLSNNLIPYLIFRSKINKPNRQILFMARQHPGETISSHIMQSLIRSLIKQHKILSKFEIICVPMLNVDGVIYGNFRTNLAGYDINRQWSDTNKWLVPQVYALKSLIQKQQKLEFVLDLHGHSKKFNSFIYACSQQNKLQQKIFPFLMSKNSLFEIQSCTYGLTRDKKTTARAFIKQLGINHIYTLQTSFYGHGNQKGYFRFNQKNYDSLGTTIINSLQELYFSKKQELKKYQVQISKIVEKKDKFSDKQSVDSGSDSNPSEDELSFDERQVHVIPVKILQQKIKKQKNASVKNLKKQVKNIRIVQKQKRNSATHISNRQVYNTSQKQQFRKTFQINNKSNTKRVKVMMNKTVDEKHIKIPQKISKQVISIESNKSQKLNFNNKKKKTNQIKLFSASKKQQRVQQIKEYKTLSKIEQNIKTIKPIKQQQVLQQKRPQQRQINSNLFLSTVKRGITKTKRTHKSLVEHRFVNCKEESKQIPVIEKQQKQKFITLAKQQTQLNHMVTEMKNNLKELSKLDRVVQEKIRERMANSLLSNLPKTRQIKYFNQKQSNLLQLHSRIVSGTFGIQQDQQQKQQTRNNLKRIRNKSKKNPPVFLGQLMRPKVQICKGQQIHIIGTYTQTTSSHKTKQSIYFNQHF